MARTAGYKHVETIRYQNRSARPSEPTLPPRPCLKCDKMFYPTARFNRLCKSCKYQEIR